MHDQYYHTPLQHPRQIRILNLAPAENPSEPIQCDLSLISLDDHPEWDGDYSALSYSWDSQMPSEEIGCNGASLLVTANCKAALRQLRDSLQTIKLWIDSICIDQSSDAVEERNRQVALMGEIYKCAKRVIVWLGKSDIYIRRAFDLIIEIVSLTERYAEENGQQVRKRLYDKVKELSNRVKSKSEEPFSALFLRSWFHRMWTVQEVTLSWTDRIVIRCGDIQMDWVKLLIAWDVLKNGKYEWDDWMEAMTLQLQLSMGVIGRRFVGVGKQMRQDNREGLLKPAVSHILINSRRKKSTEPRDKVFALCGLFKELEIPFPAPDYSRSVEAIYREAAISCINYDKSLLSLYFVQSDRRRDGLSSWVPDLSEYGWGQTDSRHGFGLERFAASSRCSAKWSFSEDGTALVLFGKIVDTVIFRADPLPGMEKTQELLQSFNQSIAGGIPSYARSLWRNEDLGGVDPDFQVFLDNIFRSYTTLKGWAEISRWSDYPTGESTRRAFQRTLVNDLHKGNAEAAENHAFDDWYNVIMLGDLDITERAVRRSGSASAIPKTPWERELFLHKVMEQMPQEKIVYIAISNCHFHTTASGFSEKRCFFFTENNYFGTIADPLPVSLEPGDKIAIVRGLELPLALRPIDGGYKLLTHVYVHGIMYGEAWPQSEESLEEIVLL